LHPAPDATTGSSQDRSARTVTSATGIVAEYDKLIIATGSQPIVIPVPGHQLAGVLSYRDLDDVNAMLLVAKSGGKAVVIGGGLLGLEAAVGRRLPAAGEAAGAFLSGGLDSSLVVALARVEEVPAEAVRYLNRLSDALFVFSRWANHVLGAPEVLWEPNQAGSARD